MSRLSKLIYLFVSFVFFVISDFYLTSEILKNGHKLQENPVFDLVFIQNEGAAFNILQNARLFLIIFALCAMLFVIFYAVKQAEKISTMAIFSVSLLCSGIFCNMYERISLGYVRDFIKLNFIDFPVFNISDIFINISVFVIVIIIIKNNYLKKS